MASKRRVCQAVLAVALAAALCGAAAAAPGTVDDSQRDFNVPGKDPAAVVGDDFKSTVFLGLNVAALKAANGIDDAKTPGGFAVKQNADNFGILNFAGVSGGLLVYNKKGQNSFHVHPRGNELVTVIDGGPLFCQIVDTTGKLFEFTLNKGDTGFFPRGLVHLQQNGDSCTTLALQAFSSGNAGVSRTIPAIFAGTTAELVTGFNNVITAAQIDAIKTRIVSGFPIQA